MELGHIYYDFQLYEAALHLGARYPGLLKVEEVGSSEDNRIIFMITIGTGDKTLLCTAGVHGRESLNPVLLVKMAENYVGRLDQHDKALQTFFDKYRLVLVPLLNPDGYMIALRGFNIIRNSDYRLKAKNMNVPYCEWKYNARGVDLNRNFSSVHWKVKFHGDRPLSESESQLLVHLFERFKPTAYLDYHSRGNEIYYYRDTMSERYNRIQKIIASRLSVLSGYQLVEPVREIDTGDSGGNTVHYFVEHYNLPAFTIETAPEEAGFPLNLALQPKVYQQIVHTPFALDEETFQKIVF